MNKSILLKVSGVLNRLVVARAKVDFTNSLNKHLQGAVVRYGEIGNQLQSPDVSPASLKALGKEYSHLGRIVEFVEKRSKCIENIKEMTQMEKEEKDSELRELARADREDNERQLVEIEENLLKTLIPPDDNDDRNIVVEVRAGTGGDEASLFAGEVFAMYKHFADLQGWKWDQMSLTKSEIGGFKEAQANISGENVFQRMKYESGVHRVQRVPVNDVKIQTSAVSVVVMPEAEEVEVELRPQDLRIDVFRAGGAGGQSVNKTESAVRITHIPTGCVVAMQDERSQIQNRARAMKYLRARVYDLERSKLDAQRSELRSLAQGTGDRSDKIRTYNFPQDRVTDHRAQVTIPGVERVLSGEQLDRIIDALISADEAMRVSNFLESIEKGNSGGSESSGSKKKSK